MRLLPLAAASLAALVAAAGLLLQLYLIIGLMTAQGAGISFAVWRYLGYFTILTNILLVLVAAAMIFRPDSRLASPRFRLAAATSIVMVGLVYAVALRATWSPAGWQVVADHLLHDATPALFLLAWLLAPHGGLRWRDALWGVVAPFLYCVYALARGAVEGWYAYWFLDPRALDGVAMLRSMAVLLALVFVIALLLVAVDRWLARRSIPSAPRPHRETRRAES